MNGYNNRSRLADAELDDSELFNEGKKSLWKLNSSCYISTRLCTQLHKTCSFARGDYICICEFTSSTNINSFLLHVYIQIFIVKNCIKEKNIGFWCTFQLKRMNSGKILDFRICKKLIKNFLKFSDLINSIVLPG